MPAARQWFRLAWVVAALCALGTLPWLVTATSAGGWSLHAQAVAVAGVFVLLALPVSAYEVALQLQNFARPRLQLRVVRILWMVPVYALNSWFALKYKRTRLALDAVRECYEAYVIYNFFMYLRAYLEDEYGDVDAYFAAKDDVPHLGPLKRVLPPWRMGAPFFRECQQGVLAYVVVRPLMSAAGLLASALGVGGGMSGGEGPFRADRAFVWAALANNASQVWALYCLVLFYTGTRHELAPIRPLSKFLVVKAVVFASYWQGIAIGALVWSKVLTPPDWAKGDVDDAAAALQEFLICVEMAFAALAHAYAFPPSDYADPSGLPPAGGAGGAGGGLAANLGAMFSVDDVLSDVRGAVDVAAGRAAGAVGAAGAGAWGQARAVGSGVARAPAALLAAAFGVGGTGKGREGGVGGRSGGGGGGLGGSLSEDGRQHSQDALWTEDELR